MEPRSIVLSKKGIIAGVALASVILAGQANADPVSFLPGGATVLFKFNDLEPTLPIALPTGEQTPQIPVGDTIFSVAAITNPLGTLTYWAPSPAFDNTQLTGILGGEFIHTFTPVGGGAQYTLTGGTLTVYNVPAGSYVPTGPGDPSAGQVCALGPCPAPWLTMDLITGISVTDPLATEVVNATTLTSPFTGSGFSNMVITGGTAAAAFGGPGSIASENFNFSTCGAGTPGAFAGLCLGAAGWPVVSFDPVVARTVPEPGTLALLGIVGLLGGALFGRRSRSA